MTPEQNRLVRHTWDQVAPMAEAAADMFYRRLFEIDPATRKLFRATEMIAQRKKLLQTLSFAINGLDDLDGLASKVEDLGRRHAGYGVAGAAHLRGADGMKDSGADVAGRLDQRRVVVAHAAARQVLGGLVFRERRLRRDPAREADAIGRHAAIFVGGQIVRLDRRLVGRLGR